MSTIVLIHGSWQGGWCWKEVVPLLHARGHHVLAPDSPGLGDDPTPFASDTMAQWTDAASAVVCLQSEPVILVGHSRGGTIVSAVTERHPGQIRRTVFVSAFMVADGESLADVNAETDESAAARIMSDDGRMSAFDQSRAPELLYGHAADSVARWAAQRLRPEPVQPWSVRLSLSHDRFGRIPRWFVETTDDRIVPLASQREAQERWSCERVVALASDHSPFFGKCHDLADIIDQAAA